MTVTVISLINTAYVEIGLLFTKKQSSSTSLCAGLWSDKLHCVYKNDTGVAHYNFNAHQLILVIFGTDVAEKVCYQMVICCTTFHNYNVSVLPRGT